MSKKIKILLIISFIISLITIIMSIKLINDKKSSNNIENNNTSQTKDLTYDEALKIMEQLYLTDDTYIELIDEQSYFKMNLKNKETNDIQSVMKIDKKTGKISEEGFLIELELTDD